MSNVIDINMKRLDRLGGRLPPMNIEAEQRVLGACLVSEPSLAVAERAGIRITDFYRNDHRRIYDAIYAAAVAPDAPPSGYLFDLTYAHLLANGTLDECGGMGYLVELRDFGIKSVGALGVALAAQQMRDVTDERMYALETLLLERP